MQREARRRGEFLSASELAQLGYCERKIAFDIECGPATSPQLRVAQQRGIAAHADFYQEGAVETDLATSRCFVATLVLGDCTETRDLRAFRDRVLGHCRVGRWIVVTYYRAAPSLCRWLQARPVAIRVIRPLLKFAGRLARLAVDRLAATDRPTEVG